MTKIKKMTKTGCAVFLLIFVISVVFVIRKVFGGVLTLPQSFALGPLSVRYYGLFIALAAASGFYLGIKRSAAYSLTTKQAEDILFYIIIGGFIGARLYHVLSSWPYYVQHPVDILKVWNGGLSIYGVIFGGVISLLVLPKVLNLKFEIINLLSWLTPSLIVGQIIGRFGNFFNYELYGYPTNLPWKMFVPIGFRNPDYQAYNYFHPLFLYEQIGLIIIFLVIQKIERTQTDPRSNASRLPGTGLFFWYLLLYNILRFGLEFLRIDSVFWSNLRVNALVSLFLVFLAVFFIVKHVRSAKQQNS